MSTYGQRTYTAPVTGFAVPPRGLGARRPSSSTARSTSAPGLRRDTALLIEHPGHGRDRDSGRRGDLANGGPISRHLLHRSCFTLSTLGHRCQILTGAGAGACPEAVCFIRGAAMRTQAFGVALALATASLTGPAAQAHPPSTQAQVWVTTPDRAELLHERAPVTFQRAASDRTTITVDPTHVVPDDGRLRRLDHRLVRERALPAQPGGPRADACASCSTRTQGIGVSFLRQPVGSSDFTAEAEHYTYDDVPAGQTDFALRALQHRARPAAGPAAAPAAPSSSTRRVKVMATPWSPPAWMKTGDSLVGGRLKDDPRCTTPTRATW